MSKKLLVVEDSVEDCDKVVAVAGQLGWSCVLATSVAQAKSISVKFPIDIVYLDRQLDDSVDGLDFINWLNSLEIDRPGILVASVINQTSDHVRALDLGADDYINKPFDIDELRARLKAIARRLQLSRKPESIVFIGKLEVRLATGIVLVDGDKVELSQKNARILCTLASFQNEWVSRELLWKEAWSNINLPPQKDPINTSISRLRKILGSLAGPIIEHSKHGYRLVENRTGDER
ncbi:MAG: response regulator transcription factor [Spongiibacteraceae bacterium]